MCDLRNELDPDFIIMARTDARGAVGGSLEHAIERARAYQHTGVDVIDAEALQSREEIKALRAAIPDILFRATEGAINRLSRARKARAGSLHDVHNAANIATIAMYGFSRRLQAREEDAWIDFQNQTKNHPPEGLGVFDLTGFPEMLKLEEKYLTQEELDKYSAPSLGCMIRTRGAKGRSKKDTDRRHTRCMHVASPP